MAGGWGCVVEASSYSQQMLRSMTIEDMLEMKIVLSLLARVDDSRVCEGFRKKTPGGVTETTDSNCREARLFARA